MNRTPVLILPTFVSAFPGNYHLEQVTIALRYLYKNLGVNTEGLNRKLKIAKLFSLTK